MNEDYRDRTVVTNLPKIGDVLETANKRPICPEEAKSEKGWAVRCKQDEHLRWYIHSEHGGLVLVLRPEPTKPFSTVKVTGHAKTGKCIFGRALE
jgi:hypothetical protein